MSTYEILALFISFIMALTSIISCIASLKAKKDTLSTKNEIATMISNFKAEQNANNNKVFNSGVNTGAIAGHISGGVTIGSRK